jgi:hypothetical protein
MFRCLVACAATVVCFAQTPAKPASEPPADVDQALRARITQFYQYEVAGKYRQAEALVAEDTKDLYYDSAKPKYSSFEIQRIEYSDDYTHAKAVTNCEQTLFVPEFGNMPFRIGAITTWKLVDGQWYMYVDPEAPVDTPFGKTKAGPASPGAAPAPAPISIPKLDNILQTLSKQVRADKQSLTLKPGEPQQVSIINDAPGTISISLRGSLPGVEIRADRLQIGAGEKAVLTFRARDGARPGTIGVLIEQTNQVIPIQIQVN